MPESTLEVLQAALHDRYTLERELGRGGMALVYLGHDLRHGRKVAVKVLRAELAAVIGAERFLHEIRVTANLQHPHILPLHDSGVAGSYLFYVMPYVEGESLRSRLAREKQLAVEEAVEIGCAVAHALDYAHRHSVIHRDIKPENILLHDGQALVADFGIALAVSAAGSDRLTETGLSIGTPQYMSPEQAMGDRALDARSDIYSLGCTVYEMLAGDPPYTGSTAQAIVAKVITEKPPPITTARKRYRRTWPPPSTARSPRCRPIDFTARPSSGRRWPGRYRWQWSRRGCSDSASLPRVGGGDQRFPGCWQWRWPDSAVLSGSFGPGSPRFPANRSELRWSSRPPIYPSSVPWSPCLLTGPGWCWPSFDGASHAW
jgi:serine/threonine protein kinase